MENETLAERRNIMRVLCCECGDPIEPNPANMCVNCLKSNTDITSHIPRQGAVNHCKGCGRWLSDNKNINSWVEAGRESKDLLAILLNKIKPTLGKETKLVDANFIWTEPHSKRLKLRIAIQQEVQHGAILDQPLEIEFIEAGGMCNDCHRMEAKDFWKCVVQVRQKRSHKKTFLYLEQLILKHNVHKNCVKITSCGDGLDFYFAEKQSKRKFVEFLQAVMPIKWSESQKLISHDVHTQTYNYKYTTLVELPHVSKDDIICLPKIVSAKNGNIGPLVMCQRVTQTVHLVDFLTLDHIEVQKDAYWRNPFFPVTDKFPLKTYMVMGVEPLTPPKTAGIKSKKHELAEMWIVNVENLGSADESNWLHARTHLGQLFNCGDLCLGFDVQNSNVSEVSYDAYRHKQGDENLPDVIIVKKCYGSNFKRHKKREWKVKRLDIQEGNEDDNASQIGDNAVPAHYENQKPEKEKYMKKNNNKKTQHLKDEKEQELLEFYNELEEDQELRGKVQIFKDQNKIERNVNQPEMGLETDTEGEELADDLPEISLAEMLDDLELGANMQEE